MKTARAMVILWVRQATGAGSIHREKNLWRGEVHCLGANQHCPIRLLDRERQARELHSTNTCQAEHEHRTEKALELKIGAPGRRT
jgi:hypothetical protein